MCQEIGHTLGLGHTSEDGSSQGTCMDYAQDSTNSQHPYPHDYAELETIYGHLDRISSVGISSVGTRMRMPAAAKRGNYDKRSEWGKLKQKAPDGKHTVYEREFSDGKLITFVEVEEEEILEDHKDQPQHKKQEQ